MPSSKVAAEVTRLGWRIRLASRQPPHVVCYTGHRRIGFVEFDSHLPASRTRLFSITRVVLEHVLATTP
jgi:hypothetical protein